MRVHLKTFGCKANQYDTERMRQALESLDQAINEGSLGEADVCVVNTCTVTNKADADARRFIRKARRTNPGVEIVVAGCSAVLRSAEYRAMSEVAQVVEGHDPASVVLACSRALRSSGRSLVPLGSSRLLDRTHVEGIGAAVLRRRAGATRGWLKVQDGCDRQCAFCATRLARGASVSRDPDSVVLEAQTLAATHPELVVTGVHIGHYGRDLPDRTSLTDLVRRLLDEVPGPRFRLGSIEATEIDDGMIDLLRTSGGRLAPHLHMPLQSGADPVLRRMRRWHTRDQYRRRALEIASFVDPLGLGADIITGFPGETASDHEMTRALVEELPYTYLHVFPFSPRDGTAAVALPDPVPERVSRERGRELRDLADEKGARHGAARGGGPTEVVVEGRGSTALTGDYMRVAVQGPLDPARLHRGSLSPDGAEFRIDLAPEGGLN